MGARLSAKIVQPKFMWKEIFEPNLQHRRKLSPGSVSRDSMDLLNMVRILKPAKITDQNRRQHVFPFSVADRSILIHAQNGDRHLFEASSVEERDTLADGLRLIVARLASMIIVGDDQMFYEFFAPWAYTLDMEGQQQHQAEGHHHQQKDEGDAEEPTGGEGTTTTTNIHSFFLSTTNEDRKALWGTATRP